MEAGQPPHLAVLFEGPCDPPFPEGVPGIIVSNHQPEGHTGPRPLPLDPRIREAIVTELGPPANLQRETRPDTQAFVVQIPDPRRPDYRPFFWDRGHEYGPGHAYYEALCHAMPAERFEVVVTSSPRYASRGDGTAIPASHQPAPLGVLALVEAVRRCNPELIDGLGRLPDLPAGLAAALQCGAFRSVAIQFHFGGASAPPPMTLHHDHVYSCLHMAVTVGGTRTVTFVPEARVGGRLERSLQFEMTPGDVYVTLPAAIRHGVATHKCAPTEPPSLALQLRTLLSPEDAPRLAAVAPALYGGIAAALRTHPVRLPSFDEWQAARAELAFAGDPPGNAAVVEYRNLSLR